MAIYHLSVKTISRSAGRSATAAAAYRAGVDITDARTGELHDYRRKGGVESTELVLPAGAPAWAADRAALWNAAEQAETRKNSTVAREFEIALPDALSPSERVRLARDFARELVERHECAADVCIHAPGKEGDHRNHHAHILLTTRRLGPDGFTEKTRELDDKATGSKLVTEWRERFAQLQNARLHENGIEARVDHRSLAAQGTEREATRHLGPAASGYERRTGEPSAKRLHFEQDAAERLARAAQAGALERQSRQIDRTILDLSGDLAAALAERERQRQVEQAQQIEAGKQQAREAFQRFQAEQAKQQADAQAAQALTRQKQEADAQREAEERQRAELAEACGVSLDEMTPEMAEWLTAQMERDKAALAGIKDKGESREIAREFVRDLKRDRDHGMGR
ncbi:Mobilization protein MobL [Thiomonas sp. X19]|nr:Mobilization protein MobL [Thiomonas sp. X19]